MADNTNNPKSRHTNEQMVYEKTISDTNTHIFPDTSSGRGFQNYTQDIIVCKVVNNQDQDLDATLQATTEDDNESWSEPIDITSAITVTASGGVKLLTNKPSQPTITNLKTLNNFRVSLSFSTAPTGNNPTKAVFQQK